jgi:uncharacterized membrane protein
MTKKHHFAPGAVTHYKARNAKHLARWAVRVVVILLSLALLSGVLKGCIYAASHAPVQQTKKVTT